MKQFLILQNIASDFFIPKMSGQSSNIEKICECCLKSFVEETILRHISKSKACKVYYGSRLQKMKIERATSRVRKYRDSLSRKEQKRALKRQRVLHANNPEIREKKKKAYKEWKKKRNLETEDRKKILEARANEEPEEDSDGKILYKNTKNLRKIFEHEWVQCHFCREEFDPLFILKHIGKRTQERKD